MFQHVGGCRFDVFVCGFVHDRAELLEFVDEVDGGARGGAQIGWVVWGGEEGVVQRVECFVGWFVDAQLVGERVAGGGCGVAHLVVCWCGLQ